MLERPRFISGSNEDKDEITFIWPAKHPEDVYVTPDERQETRIAKASPKAVLGFASGCAEWIAWRFHGYGRSGPLLGLIEAMWAWQCDWRYLRIAAMLDHREWRGPVGGPLYSAFSLLVEVMSHVDENEAETPEVVCLVKLAEYVLPVPQPFAHWKRETVKRLARCHPRADEEEDQGVPVPRLAIDPGFAYKPELASELVAAFVDSLDYRTNGYLRPPDSMLEKGFLGEPYANR